MMDDGLVPEIMTEVRRLAAMKGWRRDAAFQAELVRICLKYGDTVMLLKLTVDKIVESWDHCPSPAELRSQMENLGARPAEDPVPRWRQEFRVEVRKAMHAIEVMRDCRERRDWQAYLEWAGAQHPQIIAEEYVRMGIEQPPSAAVAPLEPAVRSRRGDAPRRAVNLMKGVMNAPTDYDRLRRNSILWAAHMNGNADSNPDDNSRKFWADHLAWAEALSPAKRTK